MIFRRLYAERFSNLPDRNWEFQPGLQLVRGPNEAGKTSMRRALTLALFGDAATRSQDVLAWQTWGSDGMRVELEFVHEGQIYRLVRDFETGKNELHLPGVAKPLRNKEQIRERLAGIMLLPNRQAFEATACMSQDELSIDDPREVHRLIERHVLCGTGVDVDQLVEQLHRVGRAKHKGEKHPAKEPGILVRLASRLDELRQEWAQATEALHNSEEAAQQLAACKQELAEAEESLARMRERRRLHELWQQSRKEHDRLAREMLQIEERQKEAQTLDGEIASLQDWLAAAQPPFEQLQAEVRNADERAHLATELAAAVAEAEQREAQHKAITAETARLEELRREAEALPIRADEAENGFARLPAEIAGIEQDLENDRRAREQRRAELAEAEARLKDIRDHLAEVAARLAGLERDLDTATLRVGLSQQLAQASERLEAVERTLRQVGELEAEIARLQATHRDLPAEEMARLHNSIGELAQLLANEKIGLRIETVEPREGTAELDGQPATRLALPGQLEFQRRAEILLPGQRITVENRGPAAARLGECEAQFAALLADCDCRDWDHYRQLQDETDAMAGKIVTLRAQRDALLASKPKEGVLAEQGDLIGEMASLEERLGETVEEPQRDVVEIRAGLQELQARDEQLKRGEAAEAARCETLQKALAGEATTQWREQELERKQEILAGILARARVSEPGALRPILETHQRLIKQRDEAKEALALALAGCRAEDVETRLEAARERVTQLQRRLAEVPDPGWAPEQTADRQLELAAAARERENLKLQLQMATFRREAIDTGALEKQHEKVALDLAGARAAQDQYKQFELDADGLLKLQRQEGELERRISKNREDLGQWRERAERGEDLRNRLLTVEEQIESWTRRLEAARFRDEVDTTVAALVEQAREQAVASLRQQLPELTAQFLGTATAGRYTRLEGAGLEAAVFSERKGAALKPDELSSGTADQFYLAQRLAALRALFGQNLPPLLMDDVLVHCDPDRRDAVLGLIQQFAEGNQVLLFSCQDYPQYAGLPALELGL